MPATLPIGTVVESGDIAELNAQRFNRHTFWCGQSGSGKTYALGVVLEQVLAHTSLPLVILDPNADFAAVQQRVKQLTGKDGLRLFWQGKTHVILTKCLMLISCLLMLLLLCRQRRGSHRVW